MSASAPPPQMTFQIPRTRAQKLADALADVGPQQLNVRSYRTPQMILFGIRWGANLTGSFASFVSGSRDRWMNISFGPWAVALELVRPLVVRPDNPANALAASDKHQRIMAAGKAGDRLVVRMPPRFGAGTINSGNAGGFPFGLKKP